MDRETAKSVNRFWRVLENHSKVSVTSLGATNQVYQLQALDETSKPTYFLRRYKTADLAKIHREHRYISEVASKLAFVPSPIEGRNRSTVLTVDKQHFALFPAARGQLVAQSELSAVHAFEAGVAMAKLHQVMERGQVDGLPEITLAWTKGDWVKRLDDVIEALKANEKDDNAELDSWALKRATQQRAYLAGDSSLHHYEPVTRKIPVHGDFHHFNVFFDECAKVSGVIDWDLLQLMPPSYDIVRACHYMFQLDIGKSAAFINGYFTYRHLTREELNDGAKAWGIYADHHVWALEEAYLHGNCSAKKFIPQCDFAPFLSQWMPVETEVYKVFDSAE